VAAAAAATTTTAATTKTAAAGAEIGAALKRRRRLGQAAACCFCMDLASSARPLEKSPPLENGSRCRRLSRGSQQFPVLRPQDAGQQADWGRRGDCRRSARGGPAGSRSTSAGGRDKRPSVGRPAGLGLFLVRLFLSDRRPDSARRPKKLCASNWRCRVTLTRIEMGIVVAGRPPAWGRQGRGHR
jgi:hypothetical protein